MIHSCLCIHSLKAHDEDGCNVCVQCGRVIADHVAGVCRKSPNLLVQRCECREFVCWDHGPQCEAAAVRFAVEHVE